METALTKPVAGIYTFLPSPLPLRPSDRLALLFFTYVAVMALFHPVVPLFLTTLILWPPSLYLLCTLEYSYSRPWTRVVRDALSLGLILISYWSLEAFRPIPHTAWQNVWVEWDRQLLGPIGLRAIIESCGPVIPLLLETVYLMLYTLPIFGLGALYFYGDRRKINQFLTVLLAGTFVAYALLPHLAVYSPRLIYPGVDNPLYISFPRIINTWLLDHLDISTSVCPSGHCAVAFSNAFALYYTLRDRPVVWITAFALAFLVYVATIYGRYHYAVDGLISIGIVLVVYQVVEYWLSRDA